MCCYDFSLGRRLVSSVGVPEYGLVNLVVLLGSF